MRIRPTKATFPSELVSVEEHIQGLLLDCLEDITTRLSVTAYYNTFDPPSVTRSFVCNEIPVAQGYLLLKGT